MAEILVIEYDPSWPLVFASLRDAIWPVVSDIARSIEHVGSTSVPGLAAKPVIDIDVVVRASEVMSGISRLGTLGYRHLGDRGIPQREAFESPTSSAPHHLYLCPQGSPALLNHLTIRDYLRAHASVARAYGDLKMGLARAHRDDLDGYTEAKTEFLAAILRTMGFEDETLAEIERVNRRRSARLRLL
jgi:GrpB-like predicted nucleotidyltransferase (UPF0157 family)